MISYFKLRGVGILVSVLRISSIRTGSVNSVLINSVSIVSLYAMVSGGEAAPSIGICK
jgi:hypothetical protein